MISIEDIEAFGGYNPPEKNEKAERAYKTAETFAKDLAYEFSPDRLYNLMIFVSFFGGLLTNEQLMKIAQEAHSTWYEEHS